MLKGAFGLKSGLPSGLPAPPPSSLLSLFKLPDALDLGVTDTQGVLVAFWFLSWLVEVLCGSPCWGTSFEALVESHILAAGGILKLCATCLHPCLVV